MEPEDAGHLEISQQESEQYLELERAGRVSLPPVPQIDRMLGAHGAAPIKLVSRVEWQARRQTATTRLTTTQGNTAHWGGPSVWNGKIGSHDTCAAKVRSWQHFHMNKGWSDIAYSSVICPHGYVFVCRWYGVRTAANGTDEGNNKSYAHCYLGGQTDPFTTEARRAMHDVFQLFNEMGSGSGRWVHSRWKSTECPGSSITRFIQAGLPVDNSTPAPSPAPSPPPPPMEATGMTLTTHFYEIFAGPNGAAGLDVNGWGTLIVPFPFERVVAVQGQALGSYPVAGVVCVVGPEGRVTKVQVKGASRQGTGVWVKVLDG